MSDLELTRSAADRRVYELDGVGTLRLAGRLGGRRATAEAAGASWRLSSALWRRTVSATDAAGTVVGTFAPRTLRRGGELRWAGRDLAVRPASA